MQAHLLIFSIPWCSYREWPEAHELCIGQYASVRLLPIAFNNAILSGREGQGS